jgi:hypothetical protein
MPLRAPLRPAIVIALDRDDYEGAGAKRDHADGK